MEHLYNYNRFSSLSEGRVGMNSWDLYGGVKELAKTLTHKFNNQPGNSGMYPPDLVGMLQATPISIINVQDISQIEDALASEGHTIERTFDLANRDDLEDFNTLKPVPGFYVLLNWKGEKITNKIAKASNSVFITPDTTPMSQEQVKDALGYAKAAGRVSPFSLDAGLFIFTDHQS